MAKIESIRNIKTELPPCCMVEVNGVLVLGTYKLDESNRSRNGTIDVYSPFLELLSSTPTKSATLDIALYDGLIYSAHSTGIVSVWKLEESLSHVYDIQLGDDACLVLQLDFKDGIMAATLTDGTVVSYDLQGQQVQWEQKSHDLEPWCVRFGNGGLWTGGDDQALCFHDLREGTRILRLKYHDAGVTSILPVSDSALWTGGYDDTLRVLDMRTRRPPADSMNLGGGVWRLLPNPQKNDQVLACCMYNGLAILEKQGEFALPEVTATQTDVHQSMVYGGAWIGKNAYTCSFYDCIVQEFTI